MCYTWVLSFLALSGLSAAEKITFLDILGQREQAGWGHTSAFSADGKIGVFAASTTDPATEDSTITVWDLANKKIVREWKIAGFEITALAISKDAKLGIVALAAGSKDKKQRAIVAVWDLEAGKKIRDLEESAAVCWALAVSPDQQRALSGTKGQFKLWDVRKGTLIKGWQAHGDSEIWDVGFRDDSEIISAGDDNRLNSWDLEGKQLRKLDAPGIIAHAFSSDGSALATLSRDQTIKTWDLKTGKEKHALRKETHGSGVGSLKLTADGKRCLAVQHFAHPSGSGEDSAISLWDVEEGKELWSISHPFKGAAPIHLSADGKQALVGGGSNAFSLWKLDDGARLEIWGGHKGAISAVAVDGHGNVFSASLDHTAKRWATDGKESVTFAGHAGPVLSLSLSRDGQHLLTGGSDRSLKYWDAANGKEIQSFKGHDAAVTCVALSPGAKMALSGGEDRTVKLWNVQTGRVLRTFHGHGDRINAVGFSPDGGWVASASDDKTIRVWPLKRNQDAEPKILEGHDREVTCLAFSPDGKTLLSGSQDQTLKLWDLAEEKVLRTLEGHKNWVTGLAFPRNGMAASTADDLTVRLWNPETGMEIDRIEVGKQGEVGRCLAFAPDGRSIAVGTSGWVVFRYRLGNERAATKSEGRR